MADGFDYEALENAREYARLQSEINSGLDEYIKGIRDLKKLKNDLKTVEENINKILEEEAKLISLGVDDDDERLKLTRARLSLLRDEEEKIKRSRKYLAEIVKDAKKWDMLGGRILASSVKTVGSIGKIPSFIGNITSKFKDMFEMDKSIRIAARDMGIMGKSSEAFRRNITATSLDTIGFGAGIKELAELQAGYSEAIGRNVMMNENALKTVSAMAHATQLGVEGAAQMAAEFDSQGLSAEKTASFVEDTLNSSSKMGLNATKVMKNISGNIRMLNRYRFKDGAKGLAEMAKTVTKLGVDMNFAAGMADKLFDLEPAIEMSAQLQVMGGAWSRLADPFRLMYMARNDVKGLTEELANAAKESMSFAKDGSIETTAMEMHRLRIVAQQTGLEYDDLLEAGKKAFKLGKIKAQVSGLDDETREFIANTAEFKDGKATIEIDGKPKLLSMLTSQDKKAIKDRIAEKKTLEERAKAAQSFDEKITNLINMVKIAMMPILEGVTNVLTPLVDDLTGEKGKPFREQLKKLGESIAGFVAKGAEWFKWFAELAISLGPTGIFATWLGGKAIAFLFEQAMWFQNGMALSKGFLAGGGGAAGAAGAAGGVAGAAGGAGGMFGKFGKLSGGMSFGKSLMKGVGTGAVLGLASAGMDYGRSKMDDPNSTGGKMLGVGSKAASWAATGALIGSIIPGLGTAAGGIIGGLLGAGVGAYDEFSEPQHDVKFPKLGASHSKGRMLMQGGKITPIHNKDELLAMKPGGVVDKTINQTEQNKPALTKVEFGDMNINGTIKVEMPGNTTMAIELAKNTEFKSSIVKLVHSQLEKTLNGGKNRG